MTDNKYPDDNPKTLSGLSKVPLNLVPPSAKHFLAEAFADGARKYGPYNWREKNVSASIYYAAAQRHMDAWWDGEDVSFDAGVHHIAHAMACMAIILDAMTVGALNDDRPAPGASPDLQQEYIEYAAKDAPENDRTDAPTGFNPPAGTIVVDHWGLNPSDTRFHTVAEPNASSQLHSTALSYGSDGNPVLITAPIAAPIGGTRASDTVVNSGVSDVQANVRPQTTNKPIDPNDPSAIEGSRFLYGDPSGAEYWGLPDGRVVRYDQQDYHRFG